MTPVEEQVWFDSWRGSHYDPRTRRIVIVGHPPAYVLAHERAHAAQHGELSGLYCLFQVAHRFWRRTGWGLWLVKTAHHHLELDAHVRALNSMPGRSELDEESHRALDLMLRQLSA